jgi:hypothetical protein
MPKADTTGFISKECIKCCFDFEKWSLWHHLVQLGALLHDIADSKFHNGDETIGPRIAREF